MTESVEDELREKFSGWDEQIRHPSRYRGWEFQAAHLYSRYNVPKMRSCVVALKQKGASTSTIADILGKNASTVSEHFTEFKETLQISTELRDVMGPHPWEDYDGYDPNMWIPLASVSYNHPDKEQASRELSLYVERVGNAVENEYLLVDRKVEPGDTVGSMTETVNRVPMSGSDTVIEYLSRQFRLDIDTMAHLALQYNGYFEPKTPPKSSLTEGRRLDILENIDGDTDGLKEAIKKFKPHR